MTSEDCGVTVIVGASRGIGAATALALAGRGVAVVLGAPPGEDLEPVIREIRAAGGQALGRVCDARRADDVRQLADAALQQHGRIGAWVNCAGVMGPVGRIEDSAPDEWFDCLTVNLVGAFNGCHAILPHFRSRDRGVIVNMSSGAAFHALEGWSAYCASKAGLLMLSRTLCAEVQGSGIRCYSFQPGMVNTDLGRASMARDVNRVSKLDPASFAGPEEPARAIAWLCIEAPADLAGTEVVVTETAIRDRVGLPPSRPPRLR
jgi:NAD(P)-dependent dehydrogenase (short-subunit alcohol dehydrogenase family)